MVNNYESLGEILVIVPTYNERENIEMIASRLLASVPAANLLVVDDNSPDGTGEIADRMANEDPRISVLHRAGKEGLGAAYVAGFRWGLARNFDVLVEMDADGSHQPEQLPDLLNKLTEVDMVKGSRWVKGGSVVNWDKKRETLSRSANIWVQAMMDIYVRDSTGGFNAFRADILRQIDLDEINSRGYTFQVDMTRRVLGAGGIVAEVPIQFMEREFGESKMNGNIILEALLKTGLWGLQKRGQQFKDLVSPLTDKLHVPDVVEEIGEKITGFVGQVKGKDEDSLIWERVEQDRQESIKLVLIEEPARVSEETIESEIEDKPAARAL